MNQVLAVVLALAGFAGVCTAQTTDSFPSRPIRIVVGFPPGGGADSIARLMADHMGKTLKQPVLVENRPGANTTLAPTAVAAAAPDGYTLLLGPDAVFGADKVMAPATVKYDETNFTPINRIASTYFVMAANKDSGIKRLADLAAKAKESAKPLFIASPGGAYLQIIVADLKRLSGLNLEEVPYKGGAPAAMAVMSGEAALTFMGPGALLPLMKDGKINAVAITNERRTSLTAGVPTLAEEGLEGFKLNFWYGLIGPAGMPADVVRKLFDASAVALADPAVREKLASLGFEPAPARSPEEFRASARQDGALLKTRVQALPAAR
jgi:tripartite-type tricarboxylate transporter receptor subunit TctC